jgi:hypothetical protein
MSGSPRTDSNGSAMKRFAFFGWMRYFLRLEHKMHARLLEMFGKFTQ